MTIEFKLFQLLLAFCNRFFFEAVKLLTFSISLTVSFFLIGFSIMYKNCDVDCYTDEIHFLWVFSLYVIVLSLNMSSKKVTTYILS